MATTLPSGGTIAIDTEIIYQDQPTITYYVDPVSKQIRGFTDELSAMQQAVEIIMSVERYKFSIYTANFGTEFEGLIGDEYGYVTSELRRRIEDAFVPDTRILSTSEWTFDFDSASESLTVSFFVHTVFGNLFYTSTLIEEADISA